MVHLFNKISEGSKVVILEVRTNYVYFYNLKSESLTYTLEILWVLF